MAAILIVEDRPLDRHFLVTLLQSAGHTVSEARDAIEGISIAEQHLPDLVISNVVTPTVEGYEFVRRMRESATGVRTPVIFYAAADHQRDARKLALSCGAADVLLKPGEPNAILATVNAVLASIGRVSPRQDSLRFDRDHLRAVNSRLASKAELVEAGGQPLAAIIEIARQIAAERDPRGLLDKVFDELQTHGAALDQEIAERRRAETALRENEARTHAALTAAGMGIWDAEFGSGRLAWSDSLAAVFGLDPARAPATRHEFFELIHPDDRSRVEEDFDRAVREPSDFASEFRTIWPDGTVHWVAKRARVVTDPDGSPIRMVGVGMDVGERKSLEEQLRQAQKMEVIGQLAGGVAHDFNNLLTAIRGYADLLASTLKPNDRRRSDVEEIVRASDRAAGLARQLLAFSRKQVFQTTLLDLNHLVTEASKMLRRVIGTDIQLVTSLAPALAPIRADAGQIEQILMNLTVNARDAMPLGGRLSIETANVVLDDSYAIEHVVVRPGRYVLLAVTDSGTGMDPETREHVFEPFFTTKERDRGTGLGLATVYSIVKQSGGYVWVYSEPGFGATFKVYLPSADEPQDAERPAAVRRTSLSGSETILLVEDEQAICYLSRALLERAGYRVLAAANPQYVEEVLRRHGGAVDLLLTDVVMPGSSGPALFERLSAERPNLKVLYMSGYSEDAVVHHARLPANATFLQKPFAADALMCKVREVLDR